MKLVQSKSILAKLMASENLIVEQRKVRTASFDVINRILTIPILDDKIIPELYDLFMGHEVGHALFTPPELLTRSKELDITFSVLNVIEDARIEKMIKSKYPGLKQPFIIGYNDLVQRNFFGTEDTNINELNFIDRANMYIKLGVNSGIDFITTIEQDLMEEILNCTTIDEVLIVARKVMDYLEIEDKEPTNPNDDDDEGEEQERDGDGESGDYQKRVESETDNALRKNQEQLYSEANFEYYYGNIPTVDMDKVIVDHKIVWRNYRTYVDLIHPEYYREHYQQRLVLNNDLYQTFRTESKKVVAYLVKEFELKKNAQQLKRASVAKTGELNMDAIFSYKFADDVFKKLAVVPNGKSHGLVLFIDWSGSMQNTLHNTVKQLLNLVMFCKQVNIPFEVYAFTDRCAESKQKHKDGDLEIFSSVNMLNILSNKMTTREYNYAVQSLLILSRNMHEYQSAPKWFSLGCTPLNAAIVTAMTVVPKFKKEYNLQIVNTVFLTDGESDGNRSIHYNDGIDRIGLGIDPDPDTFKALVIRDPKSKHQETIKSPHVGRLVTAAYLKLLKSITKCNIIGFYVVDRRSISAIEYLFPDTIDHDAIKAQFRRDNYKVVTTAGYDEYYLLRADGMDTAEDAELKVKENATTRGLVSSFTKFSKQRTNNRVVLNRFINMIS